MKQCALVFSFFLASKQIETSWHMHMYTPPPPPPPNKRQQNTGCCSLSFSKVSIYFSKIKITNGAFWSAELLVGYQVIAFEYAEISKQTEWCMAAKRILWLLNRVLQKTTVVFSESKLITRFQALRFPANKRKTREFENWKNKKLSKLRDGAIKHRKSPAVAALLWKRRDRTELSNL